MKSGIVSCIRDWIVRSFAPATQLESVNRFITVKSFCGAFKKWGEIIVVKLKTRQK